MLKPLLELLSTRQNGLTIGEISRALNAQPSAVFAMIQTLARKGRLLEIGPDGGFCAACGVKNECNLLAARGARYVLAK
jgi:predicted Zn-ribbon and HTH transcriptional regulator